MKKLFKILGIVLAGLVLLVVGGFAFYQSQKMSHRSYPEKALRFKPTGDAILDGLGRGVEYLTRHQEDNGSFARGRLAPHAAVTGLALQALVALPEDFLRAQDEEYRAKLQQRVTLARDFVLSQAQEDGGIYSPIPGFSFGVYSTSIAVVALRAAGVEQSHPAIAGAQKYLIASRASGAAAIAGGAGYAPGTRPDLNNTVNMLEALEASGLPKGDPVYLQAVEFVTNSQNRSESNRSGFPVTDDGGFVYYPGASPAGKVTTREGQQAAASYGTMSYAGLVSFLYADVDRNDPRVQSAFNWIKNNYDLSENVGLKDRGLYYYYRIIAKALDRYGEKEIPAPDGQGEPRIWAQDLAQMLLKLQLPEGNWVNQNKAFLEDNTIMVTCYVLAALSTCYEDGARGK